MYYFHIFLRLVRQIRFIFIFQLWLLLDGHIFLQDKSFHSILIFIFIRRIHIHLFIKSSSYSYGVQVTWVEPLWSICCQTDVPGPGVRERTLAEDLKFGRTIWGKLVRVLGRVITLCEKRKGFATAQSTWKTFALRSYSSNNHHLPHNSFSLALCLFASLVLCYVVCSPWECRQNWGRTSLNHLAVSCLLLPLLSVLTLLRNWLLLLLQFAFAPVLFCCFFTIVAPSNFA